MSLPTGGVRSPDMMMINEIAKYCPETFLDYYKCMNVTPDSDLSQCKVKQESLQKCIGEKVPLYNKVSTACEEVTNKFKSCITKNGGVKSKCIDEMNAVRECSLRVMAEDESNQKKGFPN